ncbi:hypothetical protein V3C99_005976 [Haemonchus contortus]
MDVPDFSGRTPLSDVIVGSFMMVMSIACGCAYSIILVLLWRDHDLMKMASYKFMFVLGVFDVVQCIPHFATGIFTITQSVAHPDLAKAMGVLATPAYVAYTVLTLVLSFNRFIQIYSPPLDAILFSEKAVINWIGFSMVIWLLFASALSSPWATIRYFPDQYSWDYNYGLKFSWIVQKVEMIIELSTILISAVFYILVIIALYRTRRRFMSNSNSRAEMKVLIQALVITAYCTILNFLWHNAQAILPPIIWTYMAVNMMWILNSGVYPIIYLIVNRAIRDKIHPRQVSVQDHPMTTKHHIRSDENTKCKITRMHLDGDQNLGDTFRNKTKVQFVS